MSLLHHMKLSRKFLTLGLIALVMVAIPSALYFQRAVTEISNSQRELRGTQPLLTINKVIQYSQVHRGMSASMLSGNVALEARRPALRDKLNAAVEAARVGEQGRGFAVVASEVRSLAGRSAEAAKEIKQLIDASVQRVAQGTVLVDQAGRTMTEVVSAIRRVTDIVGEISSSSSEQTAGVSQVVEAVAQMDQSTQKNAALVEEIAAAADSLRSQSQQMVETVSVFRI